MRFRKRGCNLVVLNDPESKTGKSLFIAIKNIDLTPKGGPAGKQTVLKRKFKSAILFDILGEKRRPDINIEISWTPDAFFMEKFRKKKRLEMIERLSPKLK